MFVPDFARWPEFRSHLAAFTELLSEGIRFLRTIARSRTALGAEVLFLRKQLAYYQEREIRPRRLTDAARLSLVFWSRFFDWKESLAIVIRETFIRGHRKGFQFYWRWKSRGGRPALPKEIRQLIARMVKEDITWGEERIADELSLKLGIYVSPRTVRKYWPKDSGDRGRRRTSSQHWRTFVKNHAAGIVACDFLVAVTVRFRVLYNLMAHPTDWTLQQLREAIPGGHGYQFLIHDRDSIFSSHLDEEVQRSFGLRVLRTPVRAPQANAYCERLIGTLRRECLDFMIPLNERHLRTTLRSWVAHYNKGRPHSSLGPAIPEISVARPLSYPPLHRYRVPPDSQIRAQDILYGLHHEYSWEDCAA